MTFVAARCPQCGGDLQIDPKMETGFCLHCGSKIAVQEAIKNVRIDNSHMVSTWMDLGDSAIEAQNYQEAYDYYTRVLEVQPGNWKANFGRGKAAGWQSTILNPRLQEAAVSFSKAVEAASHISSNKESVIADSIAEMFSLSEAFINLRINQFNKWPDQDESVGIVNDYFIIQSAIDIFWEKTSIEIKGLADLIAKNIHKAIISLFNARSKEFYNGENRHPDIDDYKEYVGMTIRCITVLEFVVDYIEKIEDKLNVLNNIKKLYEAMVNGKYWESQWTTAGEGWLPRYPNQNFKNTISPKLAKIEKAIEDNNEQLRRAKVAELEKIEKTERESKQKRIIEYWASHASERKLLETEKNDLTHNLPEIQREKDSATSQLSKELQALKKKHEILIAEKNGLGIFKAKDRQAKQTEINNIEEEISKKLLTLQATQKDYDSRSNACNARIRLIDHELTKDR